MPTFSLRFLLLAILLPAFFLAGYTWQSSRLRLAEQRNKVLLLNYNLAKAELAAIREATRAADDERQAHNTPKAPKSVGLGKYNEEVKLTTRKGPGNENYVSSTYSFYHLTRDDVERTKNGWDLIVYPGRFDTLGEWGQIMDLGETTIADIQLEPANQPNYQRDGNPTVWFRYSTAYNALKRGSAKESATIRKNHSYVIRTLSRNRFLTAGFHVKDYKAGEFVVLDQIEVFAKSEVKPIPRRFVDPRNQK